MRMRYQLSDFDYSLPDKLIARRPHRRGDSRLLVYYLDNGKIIDDHFRNLGNYLRPETTLVFNNSKVIKARLELDNKEIFVLRELGRYRAECLVFPGKRFRQGAKLAFGNGITVEVEAVTESGGRILRFSLPLLSKALNKYRRTPFPPYVEADEAYAGRYQTVFARRPGSVAAPTAGLHFTSSQIKALRANYPIVEVTLHVGLGTFAPVKGDDISSHKMHAEYYRVGAAAAKQLNAARHITAIGTTSARVLESIAQPGRLFTSDAGWTDIFITPGYKFKATNALITNFHLPRSTLLMLVAAMVGLDELKRIYRHAIEQAYRFYSFGDAMLIV